MEKVRVGISAGDINGISHEVIIRTFNDKRVLKYATPIIYGSSKIFNYHHKMLGDKKFHPHIIHKAEHAKENAVNLIQLSIPEVRVELGTVSKDSGIFAKMSLEAATHDVIRGNVDCLVTAPIHKKSMQLADFPFIGHTEFLKDACDVQEVLMMMCSKEMKVALATGHIPLQEVPNNLDTARLTKKIKLLINTLKNDFGIDKPRIAVLGMQPHAGDQGEIGKEDEKITKPAVAALKEKGHFVFGPFPADGFFGSHLYSNFDALVSCYHDQGLAPFKMSSFGAGVNMTCGLPIIRTSPDHGTAHDIAGKNEANPGSFREALFMAMDSYRMRKKNAQWRENPVNISDGPKTSQDDIVHE